jgi:hypothetical protein
MRSGAPAPGCLGPAPEANWTWPDRPGCWCENLTSPAAAVIAPRALLRPGALRANLRPASVALQSRAAWGVWRGHVAKEVVIPDEPRMATGMVYLPPSDADRPDSHRDEHEPQPREGRAAAACRATGEEHIGRGAMQREAAAGVPAGPVQRAVAVATRGSARTLPYHVTDVRTTARMVHALLVVPPAWLAQTSAPSGISPLGRAGYPQRVTMLCATRIIVYTVELHRAARKEPRGNATSRAAPQISNGGRTDTRPFCRSQSPSRMSQKYDGALNSAGGWDNEAEGLSILKRRGGPLAVAV